MNVYYLKNNNNKFFKYLSNIVTVQPNFNGEIEDENIRLLVKVRTKLYEKNIDSALKYLLLVQARVIQNLLRPKGLEQYNLQMLFCMMPLFTLIWYLRLIPLLKRFL